MNKQYSHYFLAVPCPKGLHLDTNVKVNNSVYSCTNKQLPPYVRSKQLPRHIIGKTQNNFSVQVNDQQMNQRKQETQTAPNYHILKD